VKTTRPFTVTIVNPPAPEQAVALVARVAPLIGALIREAQQRRANAPQERKPVVDALTEGMRGRD